MAQRQTKYLVQSFTIHQRFVPRNAVDLLDEYSALFSSLEDARDCLGALQKYTIDQYCDEKLFDNPLADTSIGGWRFLIREIVCDMDEDSDSADVKDFDKNAHSAWCYNIEGALLWSLPDPEAGRSDFERFDFEGRFAIGDIVQVLPQCVEPNSASLYGYYGVVKSAPVDKDAWLDASKPPDDWDANYCIQYIDRFGFLDEYQLSECCIAPLAEDLPTDQDFLPIWSRFLRGKARFPEGLADRIRARKVYLRNVPRYDFSGQ